MATAKIEVEVGKKPTGKEKGGKSTKTHPMPPKADEKADVTGQSHYWRRMQCWNCGGISSVWYDTDAYHIYTCCFCNADNRF